MKIKITSKTILKSSNPKNLNADNGSNNRLPSLFCKHLDVAVVLSNVKHPMKATSNKYAISIMKALEVLHQFMKFGALHWINILKLLSFLNKKHAP